MPKSAEREYRSMAALTVKRAAEDATEQEAGYIVEGYATTYNDPYVLWYDEDGTPFYEVIDRHALDDADMTDVIVQYDHSGMVFARNKNGSLELSSDDHGLYCKIDLGLTEQSRQLYQAIAAGLVTEMSWCFVILHSEYDAHTNTDTILKVGKVFDVSAVSIPANPGTEISPARKRALDGAIKEAKERAERLAKESKDKKIRALQLKVRIAKSLNNK